MACSYCNVFFFYISFTDDLSYQKFASLSPIYSMASNYDASKAVDRNPLTCMRANAIGQTSRDKVVLWKVDLRGIYRIYSINILFKSYDGYGIHFLPCI